MAITGTPYGVLQAWGGPGLFQPIVQPLILDDLLFVLPIAGKFFGDFDDYVSAQKNDAGLRLIVQVVDDQGVPVSLARADPGLVIKVLYPDGTTADFPATFLTNGSDGKVYYVTAGADLSQIGLYCLQAKFARSGQAKSTHLGKFWVLPNVDDN